MQARGNMLRIKNYLGRFDWKLLLFLILFLNVKVIIKLLALGIQYISQPDFKWGFHIKGSALPLFYPLMILLTLLNALFHAPQEHVNYVFSLLTGISYWIICILAIHQLRWIIEKGDSTKVYNTLILFFLLNAGASVMILLKIILETGAINPFRYQGMFQKYFISTGDYIKGITMDTSTTNAAINAFGIVFFLFKRNHLMVLVCMFTLLLTGSNLISLLLFSLLFYLFIFKSDGHQKSVMVVCLMMQIIFLAKISPQNLQYFTGTFNRLALHKEEAPIRLPSVIPLQQQPDSVLTPSEKREKTALLYMDSVSEEIYLNKQSIVYTPMPTDPVPLIKPSVPGDSIHTPPFQHKDDTTKAEWELQNFAENNSNSLPKLDSFPKLPGKIISMQQTLSFFQQHPGYLISGIGTGRFSSKLAFRTTGLSIAGGYPSRFAYIDPLFLSNHLGLYLDFFIRQEKLHSITNTPFSVYDQLLSEYGLLGLAFFFLFYLGYFIKKSNKHNYDFSLILLLCGLFFMDYWFEQLSVVVLFELLMLLKEKKELA
jgi:hypothetical protein